MTITEYIRMKREFFSKHGDYVLDSTEKKINDSLVSFRTYQCQDGKLWHEILTNEEKLCSIKVEGHEISEKIRMTVTEFWSDDDPFHNKIFEVTR